MGGTPTLGAEETQTASRRGHCRNASRRSERRAQCLRLRLGQLAWLGRRVLADGAGLRKVRPDIECPQGEPGDGADPEAPSSAQVACRADRLGTDESKLPTPQESVPASGISPSVRDTKRTGTL